VFVLGCVVGAIASYVALPLGISHGGGDVLPGLVLRNHVTQGMALSAGALLAVVLAVQAAPHSRLRWGWIGAALLLASNVVFVAYGRSGYIVLGVLALVAAVGLLSGRARRRGLVLLPIAVVGALLLSPQVIDRFELGWKEVQEAKVSPQLTSMGMRVVIWEITGEIIRDAPSRARAGVVSAGVQSSRQRSLPGLACAAERRPAQPVPDAVGGDRTAGARRVCMAALLRDSATGARPVPRRWAGLAAGLVHHQPLQFALPEFQRGPPDRNPARRLPCARARSASQHRIDGSAHLVVGRPAAA
jgi:hypothetical protein